MSEQDVSILFALPTGAEKDALLSAKSSGARGELLPRTTFDALPKLTLADDTYGALRLTSARIDPCTGALVDQGAACKNTLRLVLQPMSDEGAAAPLSAADAAVHLFYDLSRAELTALLKAELAAKKAAGGYTERPLGVHPILAKEGAGGAFGKALGGIILEYAGRTNLSRVTFLTREASRQGNWKLGGFDIAGGRMTSMKIASMGGTTTAQSVTNSSFAGDFRMAVDPMPRATDNIGLLFDTAVARTRPRAEVERAVGAAFRIENPNLHTPETMDCVSCHTTHARAAVMATSGVSAPGGPDAFTSTRKLTGATVSNPNNLHAFSYLSREPAVSQRTINETASIVTYVNRKVLAAR